jgi:hypothetical protein
MAPDERHCDTTFGHQPDSSDELQLVVPREDGCLGRGLRDSRGRHHGGVLGHRDNNSGSRLLAVNGKSRVPLVRLLLSQSRPVPGLVNTVSQYCKYNQFVSVANGMYQQLSY